MSELVTLEIVDETATLTLNDPDVRNALTVEMAEGVQSAVAEAEAENARCLVVEGAGGVFCAGGDVAAMMEGVAADVDIETRIEDYALPVNRAVQAVAECPMPSVAKVDGPAFGAGGALAIACDVVLASERARISFGFRQVGLSVDSGTSHLLPRLVGENVAKELVYTGELVESDRALDLGLVNHVYPEEEFDERADDLVADIASGPTVALEASKRLLEAGPTRDIDAAIEAEADALAETIASEDHSEGAYAFAEGREPEFEGR
ncbi:MULTISPECIES: enoyl-CoA hydratase/isomerase family protein [Salinibaculum]|uniref:enoyl-CoA hydratase/isomerase family protein n=1 Tax=Salinibaculum TaxID=2732368 RepID=UPI0030D33483